MIKVYEVGNESNYIIRPGLVMEEINSPKAIGQTSMTIPFRQPSWATEFASTSTPKDWLMV